MKKPFAILFFGVLLFLSFFSGVVFAQDDFEGPGVELIGSGSCVFLHEAKDGSFTQVRMPAREIVQRQLGVGTPNSVIVGNCTTPLEAVERGSNVPGSIADLPKPLQGRIKCANISARSECFNIQWSQTVMWNGAVKVECICGEDAP
jgi:hypothetical protein